MHSFELVFFSNSSDNKFFQTLICFSFVNFISTIGKYIDLILFLISEILDSPTYTC